MTHFYNVLKKIDEIESNSKPQMINESAEQKAPVQLQEGFDTSALKMLSGQQPTKIVECGMMPMGAPVPSIPASINMSAGNAHEIVSMMRGIMDLANGDKPSMSLPQTSMPAMGTSLDSLLPPPGGHTQTDAGGGEEPMSVAQGDVDHDGDHDMGDHAAQAGIGASPVGGDAPTDLDGAGDDEIMDLIKRIRTGEPVKVTTDQPVKVKTDQEVKKGGDDGAPEDESYSNTPDPKTTKKGYGSDDFANVINKVRTADMEPTPFGSGSNPMPDGEKKEEKKDESAAFEAQLFAEYKKFVNEG